jgi:NDP-sugar pyrophosphorylase family protein
MLPVGGRPVLEHLVVLLARHGITEIAINTHYKAEAITQYFADGARHGVKIQYSPEPRLLGTAGAAKQLDWYFRETFLVLYGDVLADVDLSHLVGMHRAKGAIATLALYTVDDPERCGIVEHEMGRIKRFVEKPDPGAVNGNLANAGIYVLEPEVLDIVERDQPADFGRDVFPTLLTRGAPMYGFCLDGYILDIGSPSRYAQAVCDAAC